MLEAAKGVRIGEVCGHGVGYFKLQFGDSHLAEDNPQASSVAVTSFSCCVATQCYLVLSPAASAAVF